MSTKRVEAENLDLAWFGAMLGAFLMACLWGGCSYLGSANRLRSEVKELQWDVMELKDTVSLLRERNERILEGPCK